MVNIGVRRVCIMAAQNCQVSPDVPAEKEQLKSFEFNKAQFGLNLRRIRILRQIE